MSFITMFFNDYAILLCLTLAYVVFQRKRATFMSQAVCKSKITAVKAEMTSCQGTYPLQETI